MISIYHYWGNILKCMMCRLEGICMSGRGQDMGYICPHQTHTNLNYIYHTGLPRLGSLGCTRCSFSRRSTWSSCGWHKVGKDPPRCTSPQDTGSIYPDIGLSPGYTQYSCAHHHISHSYPPHSPNILHSPHTWTQGSPYRSHLPPPSHSHTLCSCARLYTPDIHGSTGKACRLYLPRTPLQGIAHRSQHYLWVHQHTSCMLWLQHTSHIPQSNISYTGFHARIRRAHIWSRFHPQQHTLQNIWYTWRRIHS